MTKSRTPAQRFWRLVRIMLLATATGVAATWGYLAWAGVAFQLHFFIAITLGIVFSLLLATLLMGLAFLSNSSGHDGEIS